MRIETERLLLREFVADDWEAMAAYWAEPLYQRYNPVWDDPSATVRELVDMFVEQQAEEPRRKWQMVVVDQVDGRFVGNAGLRVNDPDVREGNIGYELDPRVWGRGYGTEAARAMLSFGFDALQLHRIWAECVADNVASQHVLEKLEMRREAHFREHQWYRGRWWDTLIYAILDHEWTQQAESEEQQLP